MARYSVSNSEVPHLWASQAQSRAYGHSVSFDGVEIRSYREPMGCLYYVTEKVDVEGETIEQSVEIALLNSGKYSVTTSGHQRKISWAVNHLTCFEVPWVSASHYRGTYAAKHESFHAANIAAYIEAFNNRLPRWRKPRLGTYEYGTWQTVLERRLNEIENALDEARLYAKTFNLTFPHVDMLSAKQSVIDAFHEYYSAENIAKREANKAKRDAKSELVDAAIHAFLNHGEPIPSGIRSVMTVEQKKRVEYRQEYLRNCKHFAEWMLGNSDSCPASYQLRETIEEFTILSEHEENQRAMFARQRVERELTERLAWQSGSNNRFYGTDENGRAFVRVTGETLETSQGANVPLAHAKLIYALATRCRAKGEAYTVPPNAPKRVGVYQLSKIDADGTIRVGCHTIAFDEMQRVANQIGFAPDVELETA